MHERELAYLKSLIAPSYAVQFSPAGMYCPYEAGYFLLSLVEKGEYSLARECLDELQTIQHTEPWNGYTVGAWYQQYYPYTVGLNLRGVYEIFEDLIVDSCIALPSIAMARYDEVMGTTRYLATVQRGLGFLKRVFQDPADLKIRDLRYKGEIENMAFCADMAEVLLAVTYALNAYGQINDSTGYSLRTFGEEVSRFIDENFWKAVGKYFQTEYPLGATSFGLGAFKQRLTFVQALTAWALNRWDVQQGTMSPLIADATAGTYVAFVSDTTKFRVDDYVRIYDAVASETNQISAIDPALSRLTFYHALANTYTVAQGGAVEVWHDLYNKIALDLVNATLMGNDGGYYEFPSFTDEDIKRGGTYRYSLYTALMVIAMKTVDATRYRNWINRGLSFIRIMTTQKGEVYNYIDDRNVKGIRVPMPTYFEGVVPVPLIPTGFIGYHTACKILAETF